MVISFKDGQRYLYEIITNKDQVFANSVSNGVECNLYKGSVSNKYTKDKPMSIKIKGDDVNIQTPINGLKSTLRDMLLNSLLD